MPTTDIQLSNEAVSILHVWGDEVLRPTAITMWESCAQQMIKGEDIDPFEKFRVTREEANRINNADDEDAGAANPQAPSAEDKAIADVEIEQGDEADDAADPEDEPPSRRSAFDDRDEGVPEGYDELDEEEIEVELVVPKKFGTIWQNYAAALEVFWSRAEYLRVDEDSITYYPSYREEAKAGYDLISNALLPKLPYLTAVENLKTLDRFASVVGRKVMEAINAA